MITAFIRESEAPAEPNGSAGASPSRLWPMLIWLVLPGIASAAEPARTWKQTAVLPAAEAHQAAAAEGKFVYAIASTEIAKYDRATGERIAVSQGKAQHLNSGFLCEGKLYCAHSNYPRKPEQSELMVLDPATMQLAVFHDFGNFGGSLTWAVRDGGHWWCNFAHYGKDNGRTFLVKFDDQWREVSRWTYPPETIARLGNNSLSGGLWRDGELLATGHDDPVLFRLRLPAEGTVLTFVGSDKVPFSGQGFALDSATGGLVGIQRDKKRVVFAASP